MNIAAKTLTVKLAGLNCDDCTTKIEKFISCIEGVKAASVDPKKSLLNISYDPAVAEETSIRKTLARLGYSAERPGKASVAKFAVEGLCCPDEAGLFEKGIRELNGVEEANVDIFNKTLSVRHRIPCCFEEAIVKRASEFGLKLTPATEGKMPVEPKPNKRKLIATIAAGLFSAAGLFAEISGAGVPIYVPFYLAAIASAGSYIARKAFLSAVNLRLDINVLMTVGVIGAVALGEWAEGASVYFLFSVANLIESYTFDRARQAVRLLMKLVPDEAWLIAGNAAVKTDADKVSVGDTVLVKPGEKIPLDGKVIKGESSVDQSPITGESRLVYKTPGEEVYSGSINKEGAIEVEITHRAADSTISRIIALVERAQAQKAPTQLFIDRFARYYTPFVIALAMGVAVVPPIAFGYPFSAWFYKALVILVVSCPCALVISTPVAIVTALTKAAKDGVLIKGGLHIENLAATKAVAFDKTGTLTTGRAAITDIISFNHLTPVEILRLAASVESRSEHPIARAMVEKAANENLNLAQCDGFRSFPGKGAAGKIGGSTYYVGNLGYLAEIGTNPNGAHQKIAALESEGKTVVLLAEGDNIVGAVALADEFRGQAPQAVKDLKALGVARTALLTGDHEITARSIASKVGVDDCFAKLLPEDKVRTIALMKERYGIVAMVGDGVNDAPALAAATVGIAMGAAGTDIALETADVALMADDLSKIPYAIRLSKKTLRLIKENVALSLLVKSAFLFMAFPGWATLWMAVGADMVVSLAVIANSLRVLGVKP